MDTHNTHSGTVGFTTQYPSTPEEAAGGPIEGTPAGFTPTAISGARSAVIKQEKVTRGRVNSALTLLEQISQRNEKTQALLESMSVNREGQVADALRDALMEVIGAAEAGERAARQLDFVKRKLDEVY